MNNFTRMCKQIVCEFLPVEYQAFFKPSKASSLRMKDLGFTNSLAAINGNITDLSLQQKQTVAKCIVGLRHRFTRITSVQFSQNCLKLKPVKFSYRFVLDITHNNMFAYLDPNCINECFAEVFDQPLRSQPRDFHLTCPDCKKIKDVSHMSLYPSRKWKSIKCTSCSKHKTARQWLCSCSIPWHSCPLHAAQGHACGTLKKASATTTSQVVAGNMPMHAFVTSTGQRPLLVNGRFLGHPGEIKRNRNRKRPAPRQPAPSKRARLTELSGIPRSFLSSSLASRFQAAIKSEPETCSSANS